jgi:hypothetical protein
MNGLHLNLHDPKTRRRALIAGGVLGLLVALILRRRASSAAAAANTAAVGPLYDPTAADATGYGLTSGIPSSLAGGGGSVDVPVTTPVDPVQQAASIADGVASGIASIDWGSLIKSVVPASPAPSPSQFTTQQLAVLGSPKAGPSPFSEADTTLLAHEFGSMSPQQLEALGVGVAGPTVRTVVAQTPSPSAPVNVQPTSGVAKSTPAPAPIATLVAVTAKPPATTPKPGTRMVAV